MPVHHRSLTLILFISLLVIGCGTAEPTATPVPATATRIALEVTNTPLLPTATPVPATATAVPPTPTDTPLPSPTDTPVPPTAIPPATLTPVPLVSLEAIPQLFENTETAQVGLGDLDGDGDLDAVFANMGGFASQIWLNDGGVQGGTPGQFVDSGQRLTEQGHGVGLGDLDGDGDLDIFMTCAHYDPGDGWHKKPSKVYLNDGGAQGGTPGTFQDSGQDIGDTELSGTGLKLIDLDGDGDLDAHVIYYEVGGMADRVYLNDGRGRFSDSGLALTEDVIAWGDLDADGDLDILAKTLGQGYGVLLNDGTGRVEAGWELENRQARRGDIALADFDGDGDLDALVANGSSSEGSYPTRLLWNDGSGQFTDSGQELNETSAAKFDVGDLDRDGTLDVFVSNVDRPNEIWLNDGSGRLTDSGLRLEGSSRKLTTRPSLGDLDGDGDLDVVVAGFQGKVEVWRNLTRAPAAGGEGGLIAFFSDRDGNDEIYVMNADGSGQRNLTNHPASDTDPAWSPDGSQIAFSSDRQGNLEIYVMDANGDNVHRLTNSPSVDADPIWSPDGTQIAFLSLRTGNCQVYLMNADGSGLQRLTRNSYNDWEIDWSPDGTQIAMSSQVGEYADIYTIQVEAALQGSTERQQLTETQAHDGFPKWSPDGSQIAFISNREGGDNWELYVMDADGDEQGSPSDEQGLRNQRRLTYSDGLDGIPTWSPDGSQIAFESNRDGDNEIYILNVEEALQDPESAEIVRLTDNDANDQQPVWLHFQAPVVSTFTSACPPARGAGTVAPDVSIYSITFVVNGLEQVVGDGDTLQALPGDEVQVREVTVCAGSFSGNGGEICADFVPVSQSGQELGSEHAGTHLVGVTTGFTTISGPSHVWTVGEDWRGIAVVLNHWPPESTEDLDCGGGRCEHDDRIEVGLRGSEGQSAADSQGQIAFYSGRDGNDEIYVVNADGSDLRRLTDNAATDQGPAFSPDGTRIAFVSTRDGNREIYSMDVNGNDVWRLTDNPAYESHPAWSPDGTQLAFISERDGNREIYVMDADGSNPRRLTNDPAEDMRPAWSPDGRQIAFNSDRDGNWEIYVMDVQGAHNLRRLTDSVTWEIFPAWSPAPPGSGTGGTQIAYRYSGARSWNGDIWVMAADGSNNRRLTSQISNDENPSWSPDGTQIVFQSDRYAEPGTANTDAYNFELLVMDADGGKVRRLTEHPAGDYWPSWGPMPDAESSARAGGGVEEASLPATFGDTRTLPADGMVMVHVPGGSFLMGSAEDDPEAVPDELPQHRVTWEWVADGFGPYSDLAQENPTGPTSGDVPVLRGGGWHSPRWEIRATYWQHELSAAGFNG